MTQPPADPTQPIPAAATREQPAVGPPATSPAWASAAHEDDGAASARPVPAPGPVSGVSPVPPAAPAAVVATVAEKKSWRSRVSGGRGLAAVALVVGLGLGAVGGATATWAVTHDDTTGTTADGNGRFDPDGDGTFGPPRGRGGMPPGGVPQQQDGTGGTTGQLPGGGAGTGTGGSDGTDANGTAQTT